MNRIALAALLPGLEMAKRAVDEELESVKRSLGINDPPSITAGSDTLPVIEQPVNGKPTKNANVSTARKEYWNSLSPYKKKQMQQKMREGREAAERKKLRALKKANAPQKPVAPAPSIPPMKSRDFLVQYMKEHDGKLAIVDLRHNHKQHPGAPTSDTFYLTTIYSLLKKMTEEGHVEKTGYGKYELIKGKE
jgi:hypothetical protein